MSIHTAMAIWACSLLSLAFIAIAIARHFPPVNH